MRRTSDGDQDLGRARVGRVDAHPLGEHHALRVEDRGLEPAAADVDGQRADVVGPPEWCESLVMALRLGEPARRHGAAVPHGSVRISTPVVGDEHRVLELRRPAPVGRDDRPAVVPHVASA